VRDHLRYHDTIWCAAHRVVELIKRDSRANYAARAAAGTPIGAVGSGSSTTSVGGGGAVSLRGSSGATSSSAGGGLVPPPGSFSTFHVRHGEFQFKVVRLGAEEIVANTLDLLAPGEMVYVATDEHDKDAFFGPLRAAYEVKFLDDYFEEANLKALPKNMLGLVDTLVAAQGRVFVGTWFSTFSGYIIRLRGYFGRHADSFYYFAKKKFAMQVIESEDSHELEAYTCCQLWFRLYSFTCRACAAQISSYLLCFSLNVYCIGLTTCLHVLVPALDLLGPGASFRPFLHARMANCLGKH